jgi:hypothetical protein
MAAERAVLSGLTDGLVVRRALLEDVEALATFNAQLHGDWDTGEPDEGVAALTRDLMSGAHPNSGAGDFTVVEDTCSGAIVSSLCLVSQRWSYDGIQVSVGRPDLVGTLPDYRRRGLVREQFKVIHQWSAERGQQIQAIAGIPNFYRRFGYEMALDMGGGRVGYAPHFPRLREGEIEPYHVRQATEADLPFVSQVCEQARKRSLVVCVRDDALWHYELRGRSGQSVNRQELLVVETPGGMPVGFLAHPPSLWGTRLAATVYELMPGVSWLAVTPSVIRYLHATGQAYAIRDHKNEGFREFGFWLGTQHPVYAVAQEWLPITHSPYAFYVRVPDVPAFLSRVARVLEQRLSDSALAGHTGELHVSFYRDGVRLAFEDGRLDTVERWSPTTRNRGTAAFPDLTFLQLVFGRRSLEELEHAFADCWADTGLAQPLLSALFPRQASNVWADV